MSFVEQTAYALEIVAKHDHARDAADVAAELESRSLPAGVERRFIGTELRTEQRGGKLVLKGTAVVYGSQSEDLGGFVEQCSPACFRKCLSREKRDLFLLHNHDTGKILARESAGTLKIEDDSLGLHFLAELIPGMQLATDVYESIRNGLVRGCSFAMRVVRDFWDEIECDPDDPESDCDDDRAVKMPRRTIYEADIFELSTTGMPAYSATSVAARSLFPRGVPSNFPLEVRSRLINVSGAPGELSADEEQELRIRMRVAALQASL